MSNVEAIVNQVNDAKRHLYEGDAVLQNVSDSRSNILQAALQVALLLENVAGLVGRESDNNADVIYHGLKEGTSHYGDAVHAIAALEDETTNPLLSQAKSWAIDARNQAGPKRAGEIGSRVSAAQLDVATHLEAVHGALGELIDSAVELAVGLTEARMGSASAVNSLDNYIIEVTHQG